MWAASAGGGGPVLRLLRDRCDGRAVADRGLPVAVAGSRLAANRVVGGRAFPARAARPSAAGARPFAAAHASVVAVRAPPAVAVRAPPAVAVRVRPAVAVRVFAAAVRPV